MAIRQPEPTDRTIGQLVADATHEVQGIVRSEIALAKAELSLGAKKIGTGAGLLGGAAFVALLGVIFLFHTLALVLDIWLPVWAAYLIVTVLLFLLAAVLGLVGRRILERANPKPEKAIDEAQRTIAAIKQAGP